MDLRHLPRSVLNHPVSTNIVVSSARRIPSLDGLRAISIAVAIASHTAAVYDPKDPRFNAPWAIRSNGQVGVEIFFVISGFLITSLLMEEWDQRGSVSLRSFYLRRAIRILPPYYVFLMAMLAAAVLGWVVITPREWLTSCVFVWNYVPSSQSWWLGHTWSLCVEEQFYLLWPLALVRLGRRGARRLAVWIVLLAPVVRVFTYFALPDLRSKLTFFLSTRADALMVGCFLALSLQEPWFERAWRRIGKAGAMWASTVFIFLVSPALFARFHFVYQMSIGYTLEVLAIGVGLFWCVQNPETRVGRFLNFKPVAFIGVLSYSLYLWQQPFIRYQSNWITSLPVNIGVIVAMALLSYYCVERPALRARDWLTFNPHKGSKRRLQVATGGAIK
jgi:peptidoglycan/LPS O-acetylase OafA/YrhL